MCNCSLGIHKTELTSRINRESDVAQSYTSSDSAYQKRQVHQDQRRGEEGTACGRLTISRDTKKADVEDELKNSSPRWRTMVVHKAA